MDFDYLFYSELPKGIKSVYVNGKRLTIKEFQKAKNDFLLKKRPKLNLVKSQKNEKTHHFFVNIFL
jgi:uncharacterized protein (DUF2267 family)